MLRWNSIDSERECMWVPNRAPGSREENCIPLSTFAMSLLRRRHSTRAHTEWVFESDDHVGTHICAVGNVLQIIREHCGVQMHVSDISRTFAERSQIRSPLFFASSADESIALRHHDSIYRARRG